MKGNKTDFYTLFVGLAAVLSESTLTTAARKKLVKALSAFERQVNERLRNEDATSAKAPSNTLGPSKRARMTSIEGELATQSWLD